MGTETDINAILDQLRYREREAPKSGTYRASTLRSIPQSSWRLMLPATVAKLTESADSTCKNSSSGWYS